MKRILFPILFLPTLFASGQLPETDIFISTIKVKGEKQEFSTPENITMRKGYDNQPFFTPDGKSLLFVAVPDSSQADIFRYDFGSRRISPVTNTKESEYSPMITPGGNHISVVRVDTDTAQRFYKLPLSQTDAAIAVNGTDSIGYYCWLGDSSLAMFILGNAMTLQLLNVQTGNRTLVASDIGRCMKVGPDKKRFYFVIKQNENEWGIFELNAVTMEKKKIISTLPGSEDFAIMPDGSFLMGSKGKLFQWKPGAQTDWTEIADFSSALGDFYRVAVNAKGDRIAMVAFTGKKP
jgi:Tol biopolymer transport system component